MKPDKYLLFLAALMFVTFFTACATVKKDLQRGWIGGEFLEANDSFFSRTANNYFAKPLGVIPVLPETVSQSQRAAVLVSRVYEKTPLALSKIREGDLILAVDQKPINSIKTLRTAIDKSEAGSKIILRIYRAGRELAVPVIVGKETYRKWNNLKLGFGFGTEIDIIPDPDFSILSLISFQSVNHRLEMHSPEFQFVQKLALQTTTKDTPDMQTNHEGWDMWFVLFGFGKHKEIMAQEIIDAQ